MNKIEKVVKFKMVYRIEDKDGGGPYIGRVSSYEWITSSHDGRTHPNLSEDGFKDRYSNYKKYVCGFDSMKSLRMWFSKDELINLGKLGFVINKYKVKNILTGNSGKQIMFRRTKKSVPMLWEDLSFFNYKTRNVWEKYEN